MSPRKSTMKRKNGKKMKGGGWFDWVPNFPNFLGSKKSETVTQTPEQPLSQTQPQDQNLTGAGSQTVTTVGTQKQITGGRKRKSSKRKTQKNKSR